jgi:hypothetical protein
MCDVGGGASVGRIPGRIPGTRGSNLRLVLKSTALTVPCSYGELPATGEIIQNT